jgi:uncharacterized protein DUF3987
LRINVDSAFHDRIEAAMVPEGALDEIREVANKAAENAARLAGVLTIVENPDASTLSNAIRLLEWLRTKSKAAISLREVMQFGPSALRGKAEAEAALAKLEEHGWLARHGEGRGAKWTVVSETAQ